MNPGNEKVEQGSERTCVVCRAVRPPAELLRLICVDTQVAVCARGKGRGSYVCLQHSCLSGLNAKGLSRAFKCRVDPTSVQTILLRSKELARKNILETVGLARRAGVLDIGADRIFRDRRDRNDGQRGILLMSSDISERGERACRRWQGCSFVDSRVMGSAAGLSKASMLRIRPGHLAMRAAYWWKVWQVTDPRGVEHFGVGSEQIRAT